MRFLSIIVLLLVSATAAMGSQSYYGSLRFKLSTSSDQPIKKGAVTIHLKSDTPFPHPLGASMQTDNSGFAVIQNLPPAHYWIQLETAEFGDHSWDRIKVESDKVTELAVKLDAVEELQFVRLAGEEIVRLREACLQDESRPVHGKRLQVNDEQKWAELWAEYQVGAPPVDFKKWRVLMTVIRMSTSYPVGKVTRVTYTPRQKLSRVRFEWIHIPPNSFRLPVISCHVEVILIPLRPGELLLR